MTKLGPEVLPKKQ